MHVPQSLMSKDWSKIEKQIIAEEEEDKKQLTGDAALNNFFQKIYADATEEQKRAMLKSFQTSGGTVLSTDWNTVEKADYNKEEQTK